MPQIMGGLMLAVAIIFFILLTHFRKISIALLIFGSMTLCVFGTAFGVWIQGVDFSITAILGVVSLMGIIVRNGIIMIDYAEELRATEHMTASEAIYHSALRRMRPIFLTSAARLDGCYPDDTGQVESMDADGYGHLLRYTYHDVVHSYCLAVLVPAYFPGQQQET